jgi:hypothetical protein
VTVASATCTPATGIGTRIAARAVQGPAGCAGRCGDDDISNAPAPATTDDKPHGTHEDHDQRLQY